MKNLFNSDKSDLSSLLKLNWYSNTDSKKFILENDHKSLINYKSQGRAFDLAIPSPDHYLPLLYTLALKEENEKLSLFNDKAIMGSLTMTSLKIS